MHKDALLPVVTLDGPAGVGKSTVARKIANELHLAYMDTGAMFRTLALKLPSNALSLTDTDLRALCAQFEFQLDGMGDGTRLLCNGVPVGDEIRTEDVGAMASAIAVSSAVRDALKAAQQKLGRHTALIAEGRDMGTVVFPDAKYKFFLDARLEVRAKRRYDELIAKGKSADLVLITAQIKERDSQDRNRAIAPLKPAADACIVDTSELDIEGVINAIIKAVRR